MDQYRVTWADGVSLTVEADNGTQAKAIGRAQRGLKKSECRIASVGPVPARAPEQVNDIAQQVEGQS